GARSRAHLYKAYGSVDRPERLVSREKDVAKRMQLMVDFFFEVMEEARGAVFVVAGHALEDEALSGALGRVVDDALRRGRSLQVVFVGPDAARRVTCLVDDADIAELLGMQNPETGEDAERKLRAALPFWRTAFGKCRGQEPLISVRPFTATALSFFHDLYALWMLKEGRRHSRGSR
ncbi:MAG: hypothetical protein KC457_31675, partial [Myxococcales bacterium]|nr:hypothetical protein [Myxococcales bacterium]